MPTPRPWRPAPALLLIWLVCAWILAPAANAQPEGWFGVDDTLSALALPGPLPTAPAEVELPAPAWLERPFSTALYQDSLRPGDQAFWHRLTLEGRFSDPAPRALHLAAEVHLLRHLEFYLFDGTQLIQHQRAGLLDEVDRSGRYTGIHLDFTLRQGQQLTLLIRKQNDGPAILPLTLYNQTAFAQQQRNQYLFWGGIIAMLLALGLYNALVYAMQPGPAYLWYLAFHVTTFLYFSGIHGYGFLIWPNWLQLYLAQHIMTLNFLVIWLVTRFADVFLNASKNAPWHHRYVPWFSWVCWPGIVASHLVPEYAMIPVFSVVQLAGSAFGISMAVVALRNRYRPAVFFLVSWICTVTGGAVGMATFTSMLPPNFFTLHGFLFGAMAELLLLSLALADRIRFMEDQMLAKAFQDPLTGAPNFSFFRNRFADQMETIRHRHAHLYLLVLDLQGFRELVGLLGPEVLDQAYRNHVERMTEYIRSQSWAVPIHTPQGKPGFFISLPGGQEMMLADATTAGDDSIQSIMQELHTLSEEAIAVSGINSKIGFRIGCAAFRPQSHSIFECFRQAQVALLTAQRNRQSTALYSNEQDRFIKHRLSLLSELRQAIAGEQLSIYIQPQFRVRDQILVGGEVLVRWIHPRDGYISPGVFIPLAEQSQLIFDITRQVLAHTCRWLQQQTNLPADFHLSVNLSALDINDRRLLPLIEECITTYKIERHRILFEVTESAVMDDPERFLGVIRQLHDLGFKIAIDDFGTGYSSMAYLQQMNADEIKIDIRFVRDIHHSTTNQNIVKAIVQLARATSAYTVAEGIETEAELNMLRALECDIAQGFLWSAALPANEFSERFLGNPRAANLQHYR
ncbi:MAG TPA: EAL domain-containing protein [Dongiaceae bacterium]|nr:EAL domain-containing protein [Dongiaceae bacterium]